MTNSFQAGGGMTYSFFGGSTCSGTGTPVGSPVTVPVQLLNPSVQLVPTAGTRSMVEMQTTVRPRVRVNLLQLTKRVLQSQRFSRRT
jgi:hypothetical protein